MQTLIYLSYFREQPCYLLPFHFFFKLFFKFRSRSWKKENDSSTRRRNTRRATSTFAKLWNMMWAKQQMLHTVPKPIWTVSRMCATSFPRIPGNAFEASGERCVFTQTQTLKRRLNEWHPGVVHESLLFDRHAIPSIRVKRDFWNQVFSPILETFRVDSILNLDSIFAPMRPGLKQTITM